MEPRDTTPEHDRHDSWDNDLRVRRALTDALTPHTSGGQSTDAALARLLSRVHAVDGVTPPPIEHTKVRRRWITPIGIGATVIAAVCGVLLSPTVRTTLWPKPAAEAPRQYATSRAERMTVSLENGSTIILAPETKLRYSHDETGAQIAELVGEAFFTVQHDPHHPFVVRAGGVTTRVLGTAFNVRRYADEQLTTVAVANGRVATGQSVAPVVLVAGREARVSDSSIAVSTVTDPEQIGAWTQGRLMFHNAPVSVMLATLGRWYGYEFRLADTALAARHVSLGFNTDRPVEAMAMIKAVLGVTMTFDGNIVTLRPTLDRDDASLRSPGAAFSRKSKSEVGK